MSNYSSLKATINANVKQNGNQEITGAIMNSVLNAMVDSLGAGYQYKGVATPATNPGTPDYNVFYLASEAGTYTNFGGLVIGDNEVAALVYNGSWTKQTTGAATASEVSQLAQGKVPFTATEKTQQYTKSGYYINLSSATVGSAYSLEELAASLYVYWIIPCEAGDIFKITTKVNTSSAKAYCILDADNKVLVLQSSAVSNSVVTIPTGGVLLIVNSRNQSGDNPAVISLVGRYAKASLADDIEKINNVIFGELVSYIGAGNTYARNNDTGINAKGGHTYRFTPIVRDWAHSSVTSTSTAFAIGYNDGAEYLLYTLPCATWEFQDYYDITFPVAADGQKIVIGGRANSGTVVSFMVTDITEDLEAKKQILIKSQQLTWSFSTNTETIYIPVNIKAGKSYVFHYKWPAQNIALAGASASSSGLKIWITNTPADSATPVQLLRQIHYRASSFQEEYLHFTASGDADYLAFFCHLQATTSCLLEMGFYPETLEENDITNIERLLGYKESTPVFTVEQGNIYNGLNINSTGTLRMANYFPVVGGTTLRLYHAQDIQIRLTEYSNPTATSAAFVKSTGYGAFEQVVLEANTKFIRISASYGDRGFDDSNPVSPSDYQSGDFGYYKQETVLNGTLSTAKINDYDDLSIFVDSSTWKVSTSEQYRVKIIPVTGGGTIFCKARNNATTRIAFLNSFDEATIRSNAPVAVDGLGNRNTTAGSTRTYDIPQGCKFIALSSWYAGETLPDSLIIDGVEYMKTTQDNVTVLNQVVGQFDSVNQELAAIEQGSFTSIIGRNISRDAAVRATGKTAISSDIKPLSFIHVSDIHTKSNNFKCFKNACEFFQHYANIKTMIVTGDLVWDDFRDSMDYYNEAIEGTTKPILNVIGNHDAGQWHVDLSSVSTDKQCYDRFIAPYVSGWGVVQPENAASEGKSYYYKDFADEKVRLIVLCEFETDYQIDPSDPNKLLYSREFRAMRQAQVTWLIETLTSTPSDYGVVVALHQPLGELGQYDNEFVSFDLVNRTNIFNVYAHTGDLEWLARIIDAFARKTSLSLSVEQTGAVVTTLNCSCDFSNVEAELICVLCGHTHQDYVGRLRNYPSIAILCVGADNLLYTSGFQPRAEGTPSEDLFNVVNIDRNRKTIKIIRIGSDASVTGQVRDQMLLNYGIQ